MILPPLVFPAFVLLAWAKEHSNQFIQCVWPSFNELKNFPGLRGLLHRLWPLEADRQECVRRARREGGRYEEVSGVQGEVRPADCGQRSGE